MTSLAPSNVFEQLVRSAQPFLHITQFSHKPGIYAVFFCGGEAAILGSIPVEQNAILYIGKTETSQAERDAQQHFASCETGRSTLRRSLGALLMEKLQLTPQLRDLTETGRKKCTNYRFDDAGEERLTEWMRTNLALGYYEYPARPNEICCLEESLIKLAVPPLNIQHNPCGPYVQVLKRARAQCAHIASRHTPAGVGSSHSQTRGETPADKTAAMTLHSAIADVLKDCPGNSARSEFIAEEIGRRKTYIRRDGSAPEAWQVRLRARKRPYADLFEATADGKIRLRKHS